MTRSRRFEMDELDDNPHVFINQDAEYSGGDSYEEEKVEELGGDRPRFDRLNDEELFAKY